jgi:cytidylate kinase
MKKIFDYFDERYRHEQIEKPGDTSGPLITLSRLTGCDGREVAASLVASLNMKYNTNKWRWVDKDIIYNAAKELKTDSERIESYYMGVSMSSLSEMIMAFSGSFVTDSTVKKTIKEVVLSIAQEGYCVLIGRGGVSITRNMPNAIHVRLVAPLYWRVENVMRKKGLSLEKAEEYVVDTDEKRYNLIANFLDKKPLNIDYLFDATINRSSFTIPQITEMVMSMYAAKVKVKV